MTMPESDHQTRSPNRRQVTLALAGLAALTTLTSAGCGGGGGATPTGGSEPAPPAGTFDSRQLSSSLTRTTYPIDIYLPPAAAGSRSTMAVIVVLDGESWFSTLAAMVQTAQARAIVVGVRSAGQRSHDFVPNNSCTANGGGEAAFLEFLRQELLPVVHSAYGGDPAQRVLFGHSHGGSFVLHALFAEAPQQRSFRTYLASDASLGCMPTAAMLWELNYAALHSEMAARLHQSYATQGNAAANVDYIALIERRGYRNFSFRPQAYQGTHLGIVPAVLTDGLAFALGTAA